MASQLLERDSAIPLYAQLEEILRGKIANGEWRPGQRIPSENELNRLYELSRMTARGVLTKLVNDGLLFRVPGKGTYVSLRKIEAVSPAYKGVREQLESMGYETHTELVGIGLETASASARDALHLEEGEEVYAIHRVRSVQGEPISLHHSFVPARLASGLDKYDVVTEQLCVILESHYGLAIRHVEEHLEAISAGPEDSRYLAIRRGAAVLLLEDTISDSSGTSFEYSKIVFRGDKVKLDFNYER